MKKKILACVAVLIAVMLTGCMRVSVGIDIKEDGKADVSMLYAVADELMNMGLEEDEEPESTGLDEEEVKKLQEEGWTYSEYVEDGFSGYMIKKSGVEINAIGSEFSTAEDGTGLGSEDFVIKENDGVYTIDWKVLSGDEASESTEYAEYFDMYKGYMNLVITLPEAAINSNASEVSEDGKTLTWNLLTMGEDAAHVEFKLPSKGGSMMVVLIVAIVVIALIIVLLVVFIARKSAKKNKVEDIPMPTETTETTENNDNNQ